MISCHHQRGQTRNHEMGWPQRSLLGLWVYARRRHVRDPLLRCVATIRWGLRELPAKWWKKDQQSAAIMGHWRFRHLPQTHSRTAAKRTQFDHLVGDGKPRVQNVQANRARRLHPARTWSAARSAGAKARRWRGGALMSEREQTSRVAANVCLLQRTGR
jgi:hypothetical protein